MSEYVATVEWSRDGQNFADNRYSRAHDWRFDGGAVVQGVERRRAHEACYIANSIRAEVSVEPR